MSAVQRLDAMRAQQRQNPQVVERQSPRSTPPADPQPAPDGVRADEIRPDPELQVPAFWHKGQLLNVRNRGIDYCVTLLGEEYDPRYPERALHFTNPARCQDFISAWYAREHFDPRAF